MLIPRADSRVRTVGPVFPAGTGRVVSVAADGRSVVVRMDAGGLYAFWLDEVAPC